MRKRVLTNALVAVTLVTFLVSCGSRQETEFDKYEAMERLSTADLIDELIDRKGADHPSNHPLDFGLDESSKPSLTSSAPPDDEAADLQRPINYLGSHKDFAELFKNAHEGDAKASLAIADLYAKKEDIKNFVLSYMYLKLAIIQGEKVAQDKLNKIQSQMSPFEIGLAEEALLLCKIDRGIVEKDSMERMLSECPFRDLRALGLDMKTLIKQRK